MKHPYTGLLAGLLLAASAAGGCGGRPPALEPQSPILIFAAASTTNAIDEIAARFARQSGVEVKTNYAAASTLARQVENGAEAHLFLSADVQWADYVAAGTPVAKRREPARQPPGDRRTVWLKARAGQARRPYGRRVQASCPGRPGGCARRQVCQAGADGLGTMGQTQGQGGPRRGCPAGANLRRDRQRPKPESFTLRTPP